MKIVNATPHPVRIKKLDGTFLDLPKGENVPRISFDSIPACQLDDIQLHMQIMGDPENMPQQIDGVHYIVSQIVASHPKNRNRGDLFFPGNLIRDDNGNIIGADGLSYLP